MATLRMAIDDTSRDRPLRFGESAAARAMEAPVLFAEGTARHDGVPVLFGDGSTRQSTRNVTSETTSRPRGGDEGRMLQKPQPPRGPPRAQPSSDMRRSSPSAAPPPAHMQLEGPLAAATAADLAAATGMLASVAALRQQFENRRHEMDLDDVFS